MNEKFVEKERKRIEIIQNAIAAAQKVIEDANPSTDDEHAYLLYKTGGNLLAQGMEHLDKRMFIVDLQGMTSMDVKLTPVSTTNSLCQCGRELNGYGHCSGCLNKPMFCRCRKSALPEPIKD